MKISMIVAMDENRAIATTENNSESKNAKTLPWHLPDDFAYFKEKTINKVMIMGRKTFMDIGFPLPNRTTIILSKNPLNPITNKKNPDNFLNESIVMANSTLEALEKAQYLSDKKYNTQELMIAGGGEIYNLFMPIANELLITLVHTKINQPTTFFPEIPKNFKLTKTIHHKKDSKHKYSFDFLTYQK